MPSQAGSGAHPVLPLAITAVNSVFQCLLRQGVALTEGRKMEKKLKRTFQCLLRQGVALTAARNRVFGMSTKFQCLLRQGVALTPFVLEAA